MKVLFLIPKSQPPTLDGTYSKHFKDFINVCLQKDSTRRPTARELLKHRFIRSAKKVSYLTELIEAHERWLNMGNGKDSDSSDNEEKYVTLSYITQPRWYSELMVSFMLSPIGLMSRMMTDGTLVQYDNLRISDHHFHSRLLVWDKQAPQAACPRYPIARPLRTHNMHSLLNRGCRQQHDRRSQPWGSQLRLSAKLLWVN